MCSGRREETRDLRKLPVVWGRPVGMGEEEK